jgi:amidohydrolase
MSLLEQLQAGSKQLLAHTTTNRRHLHRFPELSYEEKETRQFVCSQLDQIGVKYSLSEVGYGVIGLIEGRKPDSGYIALRADMDALPITELNKTGYISTRPGVMHACGHDAHTSSLLSCAKLLHETKHLWSGTVKLIFQPAEERLPGGASLLIKEGVLQNPAPASIIGQHVAPNLDAGLVGFRGGKYMASADELYITIIGGGGHGAMPHTTIDPITISAQVITAWQQIISRQTDPTEPTVLTIGKIWSDGGSTNVIPDRVFMEGTFRAMNETIRNASLESLVRIGSGIAESMGGRCELRIERGYPTLFNDVALTSRCREAAEQFLGAERVVELPLRMTAEDFAYYAQEIPGCFYRLGTRNEAQNITSGLHTATFDIDETCLGFSPGLMAWMAIAELQAK